MSLSRKLFGRKLKFFELIVIGISLLAGSMTIFQNIMPTNILSISLQENITQTPPNFFFLFLGIILIILTILYLKKK